MLKPNLLLLASLALVSCGGGGSDGDLDASIDGRLVDSRGIFDAPIADAPAGAIDGAVDGSVDALPDAALPLPDGLLALPDAPVVLPPDAAACPSLAPASDGTTAAQRALLISEIDPGSHIEVYNASSAAITLGTSGYYLCSRPSYVSFATAAAGMTIEPGGYRVLPWPAAFTDVDAGGEIALYLDASFAASTSMMDFVCWGTNPHLSRRTIAEAGGKWGAGACAGVLTGGAIHRVAGTAGTSAADYDVASAPSPLTCPAL